MNKEWTKIRTEKKRRRKKKERKKKREEKLADLKTKPAAMSRIYVYVRLSSDEDKCILPVSQSELLPFLSPVGSEAA